MSSNGVYETESEVRAAVDAELRDPEFIGKKHHDLGTYTDGCRGPLCKKRSRDYGRQQYRTKNKVPAQELHKPTVRTRWDALLNTLPTRLQTEVAS